MVMTGIAYQESDPRLKIYLISLPRSQIAAIIIEGVVHIGIDLFRFSSVETHGDFALECST